MAITIPGCTVIPFSDAEQAEVTAFENLHEERGEIIMGLPRGTLRIEFAKAVAVDAQKAGHFVRYTDGQPFYVMEVKAQENSKVAPDQLRLYLMQMAFNAGAGSVRHSPPVLFRNFRGDVILDGVRVIQEMLNPM